MKTIKDRIQILRKILSNYGTDMRLLDKLAIEEIIDWMKVLEENPPKVYYQARMGSRVNNVFVFQCSDIKDPVDCGVYMLKPCIHKYFKMHNFSESTSKVEKQMAIVALCHRIEEGLIDYLDELEEFNS